MQPKLKLTNESPEKAQAAFFVAKIFARQLCWHRDVVLLVNDAVDHVIFIPQNIPNSGKGKRGGSTHLLPVSIVVGTNTSLCNTM